MNYNIQRVMGVAIASERYYDIFWYCVALLVASVSCLCLIDY